MFKVPMSGVLDLEGGTRNKKEGPPTIPVMGLAVGGSWWVPVFIQGCSTRDGLWISRRLSERWREW
jgi:hypothetical protein